MRPYLEIVVYCLVVEVSVGKDAVNSPTGGGQLVYRAVFYIDPDAGISSLVEYKIINIFNILSL